MMRPDPASARHGSTDPVEQIRGLAELREAGIFSNEEFEAKKTEILGRVQQAAAYL
jgi:hypothetical protein